MRNNRQSGEKQEDETKQKKHMWTQKKATATSIDSRITNCLQSMTAGKKERKKKGGLNKTTIMKV